MVMFSPCRSSCHRNCWNIALSPRLPSSPPPAVYHWIFHLRPASSPRPSPFFSRILHYVLFNVLKRLSIRTTMNPTLLKYTSFFFIRRCRFERIWEKIKFNEISNSCGVEKSSGNLNFGWNFLREENGWEWRNTNRTFVLPKSMYPRHFFFFFSMEIWIWEIETFWKRKAIYLRINL